MQYGTTSDYSTSYVKIAVDAWKDANASAATEARLLEYDEMITNLGYENNFYCTGDCYYKGSMDNVPTWVYNSNYFYWMMTPNNDSTSNVWTVNLDGNLNSMNVTNYRTPGTGESLVVRPVITLSKSVLQ